MPLRTFLLFLCGLASSPGVSVAQRTHAPPAPNVPMATWAAGGEVLMGRSTLDRASLRTFGLSALVVFNATDAEVELVLEGHGTSRVLGRLRPGQDSTLTAVPSGEPLKGEARAVTDRRVVDEKSFWLVPIETGTWRVVTNRPRPQPLQISGEARPGVRRGGISRSGGNSV